MDPFAVTDWKALEDHDLDYVAETYRAPLVAYFARRLSDRQCAEDLAQEFLAHFIERGLIERVDRTRGSFRQFLLHLAGQFLIDRRRSESTRRRGGGEKHVSLEDVSLAGHERPERDLERRWVEGVLEEARERFEERCRSEGRSDVSLAFRLTYLEEPRRWSQERIATRLGVSVARVKRLLQRARNLYRKGLEDALRRERAAAEDLCVR